MRSATRLPTMMMGLILAGCGTGVNGIAVPPPMDMTRIERPSSPNTALAAPAGFTPKPDIVTRPYDIPAPALYAAVIAVAEAQPRTFLLTRYDDKQQAHFVTRTMILGFPDLIAVQVVPDGPSQSQLVLWSRSIYGTYDFGVNRKRLQRWLAALGARTLGTRTLGTQS